MALNAQLLRRVDARCAAPVRRSLVLLAGATCAALLVAFLTIGPAQAQGQRGGPHRQAGPQHPGPHGPQREMIRDERAGKAGQGLSPDERRQLRRDIRDAGRDVYGPGK